MESSVRNLNPSLILCQSHSYHIPPVENGRVSPMYRVMAAVASPFFSPLMAANTSRCSLTDRVGQSTFSWGQYPRNPREAPSLLPFNITYGQWTLFIELLNEQKVHSHIQSKIVYTCVCAHECVFLWPPSLTPVVVKSAKVNKGSLSSKKKMVITP